VHSDPNTSPVNGPQPVDKLGKVENACYHPRHAKPPFHLTFRRAKVFVDDAGIKALTECERCGQEKYIVEGQTVCEECRAHSKRKQKQKRAG